MKKVLLINDAYKKNCVYYIFEALKNWFCETFFWFCASSKLIKNCLFSLDYSLLLPYFAKIARFYWNLPISPLFEAQNCGNSGIGNTLPAHNFHRQREAQNRGFGEKSPEMATLLSFENITDRIPVQGQHQWKRQLFISLTAFT